MTDSLHRITGNLGPRDFEALHAGRPLDVGSRDKVEVVGRDDGSPIDLEALNEVLQTLRSRFDHGDRRSSDAWASPRVHWSLRLTRRQAADSSMWEWLAHHFSEPYVVWRWDDGDGVPANRYRGGINKQAFARLWWAAELFRDGDDYSPVVDLFVKQDFPNSYIHRAFVRNRPLALATVAEVMRRTDGNPDRYDINGVARVVNLWIAPLSIEAATRHWAPDHDAYRDWIFDEPGERVPDTLPNGPSDGRVPDSIMGEALKIARDVCETAGLTDTTE